MTPTEIEEACEKSIANCKIPNVSQKFKEQFRKFIESNLVNEIKRVRESIGLKNDNITTAELKYERNDAIL